MSLYKSCKINPYVRNVDRFITEPGSPLENEYKLTIADKKAPNAGEWIVEVKGVINAYEKIQSHKESVELQTILKKYMNGDVEALNKVNGVYADITNMPKTLADMYAKIQLGISAFEDLPLEVRKEYGHNPTKWFEALSTGEFDKFIIDKYGKKPDIYKEEVKVEEKKVEVENE